MPKIIIKEYDKTTPGASEYESFAVAIPGLVASGKGIDCFDENGVYECSSQTEFVEKIGKVKAESKKVDAKGPTLEKIGESDNWYGKYSDLTPSQMIDYQNCFYEREELSATETKQEGKFIKKITEGTGETAVDKYYKYGYKYKKTDELESKFYIGENVPVNKLDSTKDYSLIKPGNEGNDEIIGTYSYGNQIAYELLGLGYTVYYKKLESWSELAEDDYWECFLDRSAYDFRYIMTGLMMTESESSETYKKANQHISRVASFKNNLPEYNGRGDCIALCDIKQSVYSQSATMKDNIEAIIKDANSINEADKYTAFLVPHVYYELSDSHLETYANNMFPASFHYLACAAKAKENNYAEWYAVAGYTRGVSDFKVSSLGCRIGDQGIQVLQPRETGEYSEVPVKHAINVITKVKDNVYLWGNRTAHDLDTDGLVASHFLNIRQLCCTLKKTIYNACRKSTFDPNSDLLWINFCAMIQPTLDKMKGDQGIADYEIIKVKTEKKALLTAKIRIVPIEAVEDFEIGISLEDSLSGSVEFIEE